MSNRQKDSQFGIDELQVGKEYYYAYIEGESVVHLIVDGESLCGRDFVKGNGAMKAKKWYRIQDEKEVPSWKRLCNDCRDGYSSGTTTSRDELMNEIRRVAELPTRNSPSFNKSELVELLSKIKEAAEK